MKKTIVYSIFISVISALVVGIVILISIKVSKNEIGHNYVTTYVTEKYYADGYCWAFGCYQTDYIIVSVEKDENGYEKKQWTSHVDVSTYNAYDVGSIMYICTNHKKVKCEE